MPFGRVSMMEKRKRFRFSEAERIKAIREFYNNTCEGITTSEKELWERIHAVLCQDMPRFARCSIRLLQDHIMQQVNKYKAYIQEDSEKGIARMTAEWGIEMKKLMSVWSNYESLVHLEHAINVQNKSIGRPKRECKPEDVNATNIAIAIRETTLPSTTNTQNTIIGIPNEEDNETHPDIPRIVHTESLNERFCSYSTSDEAALSDTSSTRESSARIKRLKKPAHGKCDGAWLYLSEKAKHDKEIEEKRINTQKEIEEKKIKLEEKRLEFEKEKLEFEREKWRLESERLSAAHEATATFLTALAKSGVLTSLFKNY